MRDFVSHDGCEFVVGDLQLLDQAGIHGNLAARHAPGIDLVRAQHIHLPLPAHRVVAEHGCVRDQPLGNTPHAFGLRRIAIEGALLGRPLTDLLILLRGGGVDLCRARRKHGHLLRPVDAHHTTTRGLHGLAATHHQAHAEGPPQDASIDLEGERPGSRPIGLSIWRSCAPLEDTLTCLVTGAGLASTPMPSLKSSRRTVAPADCQPALPGLGRERTKRMLR